MGGSTSGGTSEQPSIEAGDGITDGGAVRDRLGRARPPDDTGLSRELSEALLQQRMFGGPLPRLGRFEIRGKLGQGGMSVVFDAFDPTLDRRVAIKVLLTVSGSAEATSTLVDDEARALAKLAHPNVVTVYELGEERGQRYVCMQHVDGGDLAAWLEQNPEASFQSTLSMLIDAGRGLAAAHDAGIVHRDFKPENVLVGQDGVARVTDLGLARPMGDAFAANAEGGVVTTSVESRRRFAGTPGYLAPELIEGEPATIRSDLYAYFVSVDRVTARHPEATHSSFRAMIDRGTATRASDRFADMHEALAHLQEFVVRNASDEEHARSVLLRRLQSMWIDGIRGGPASTLGRSLDVPAVALPELAPDEVRRASFERISLDARGLAEALARDAAAIVMVGPPGSGKTVRLLDVADVLLARAQRDATAPMPVVVNVSSFANAPAAADPIGASDFVRWMQDEMVSKYALPRRRVEGWIEARRVVFLLDGLDELALAHRSRFVDALDAARANLAVVYLLASREDEYVALPRPLRCDLALRVEPLSLERLERDLGQDDDERSRAVLSAMREDPELRELLRNPLLLSLFWELAAATESRGGAGALSAERPTSVGVHETATDFRSRLYEATLRHAMAVAPAIEAEAREPRVTELVWLARALERSGKTELWLEEISPQWLDRVSDRALGIGIAVVLVFIASFGLNMAAAWVTQQGWISGIVWGSASAMSAFVINRGLRIVPMEAMTWSWQRFRAWVPYNVGMGLVSGGIHGLFHELVPDMLVGAAAGLFGMSMIGMVPSGRERGVEPNAGMWESLRNACVIAPATGLFLFVTIGWLTVPLVRPLAGLDSMYYTRSDPGFAWGLTIAVAGGYATWIATGMWAPIAHLAIRVVAWFRSPLPFDLRAWLDEWVRRGMLRRVGGGWVFRHQTIREWLARR